MLKWKLRFLVKIFLFKKNYFELYMISWAVFVRLTSCVLTMRKKCNFIGKLGLPAPSLIDPWILKTDSWVIICLVGCSHSAKHWGQHQGWVQFLGVDNKHYPEPALKNVENLKSLHRLYGLYVYIDYMIISPSFRLLKVEYHPEGREKIKRRK